MPTLHREQIVPLSPEDAFRFFEDPYNLLEITPPHLNLTVTSSEHVEMRAGAEITYTIRWMGLPLRWRTLIRDYDPPRSFTDVQLRGPYRKWEHTHTFVPEQGGTATRIIDDVDYEVPFGPFGRLALPLIRRQLNAIFDHRRQQIERLLATPAGAPIKA